MIATLLITLCISALFIFMGIAAFNYTPPEQKEWNRKNKLAQEEERKERKQERFDAERKRSERERQENEHKERWKRLFELENQENDLWIVGRQNARSVLQQMSFDSMKDWEVEFSTETGNPLDTRYMVEELPKVDGEWIAIGKSTRLVDEVEGLLKMAEEQQRTTERINKEMFDLGIIDEEEYESRGGVTMHD